MAAPKKQEAPAFMATLERGRVYLFAGRTFERGKGLPITAAERAHLEKHATDRVIVHDSEEGSHGRDVQKFRFDPLPDAEPTAAKEFEGV